MKLTKLNERIEPLIGGDDPKVKDSMPSYKHVLLLAVGNVASDATAEIEAAYRLLTQIKAAEDELELVDESYALLYAIVGKNPLKLPIAIMGAVLEKLKSAEN